MSDEDPMAIGGYFGLEAPATAAWPFADALALQSARAAFLALLQAGRPHAVWLPWLLCDAMAEPLLQAGVAVHRYALGPDLRPSQRLPLAPGEWLLMVNYFGLGGAVLAEMSDSYPAEVLVADHAQALFAPRLPVLATLASPRKFVGVPDGGLLWTRLPGVQVTQRDGDSLLRARGLLQRTAADAESGYAAYADAERSLSRLPPLQMSTFTRQLLLQVDWVEVQQIRRRNFAVLHEALGTSNRLQLQLGEQVPLCYPYWPQRVVAHERLHARRVYVPRYWPEVMQEGRGVPAFEQDLARELLPLPLDQRYDAQTLRSHVLPLMRP